MIKIKDSHNDQYLFSFSKLPAGERIFDLRDELYWAQCQVSREFSEECEGLNLNEFQPKDE